MWFVIHPIQKMKQGLFFVDQSKTASTTMGEVFWHPIMISRGHIGGVHKTAKYLKFNYPKWWNPYYKYSVIRNPYDRFVSAYFYKTDAWLNNLEPLEREISKEAILRHMNHLHSFPMKTQVSFIIDDNGGLMIDQLMLYDTVKEETGELVKKLKVPFVDVGGFDNIRLQKTIAKPNWKVFYDKYPDLWHLVTDIYKDDIKLFKKIGGDIGT